MTAYFASLFDLPHHIILSIFEKWLLISDMGKLDTATFCSATSAAHRKKRDVVLSCLSNPNATFTGICGAMRVDVFSYTRWITARNVTVLRNLCIKNGYKHICKKVPSLCDVVGSVDSSTARTNKTEHASGGVFNYTPDSIEQILHAMNLPEREMRFLDAGCGNAMFATLIQMSFPSAEVVGIDLAPVITTLKSIQKYCSYKPFKDMKLYDVDIETPAFAAYVNTFQPTHAACIVGLHDTEAAFLAAVQAVQSVQCIAVAEKRNPAQDTDFEAYGFKQTHRVTVHLTGSRKKRYILVATRACSATSP